MKTLIVYYSRTGTTKKLADDLARELNADKEEIIDLRNRKGIFGYLTAGRDALRRKYTEIAGEKFNPSDYDLVLIGTPIWAGKITPAVRTYMRCHKDKFGNVACFCTMGGSHPGTTFQEFEKSLEKKPVATLHARTNEVHKNLHKDKIKKFALDINEKVKLKKINSKKSKKKK